MTHISTQKNQEHQLVSKFNKMGTEKYTNEYLFFLISNNYLEEQNKSSYPQSKKKTPARNSTSNVQWPVWNEEWNDNEILKTCLNRNCYLPGWK